MIYFGFSIAMRVFFNMYMFHFISWKMYMLEGINWNFSSSGGRLNKKDGLTRYGDSHVKDKTS